MVSSKYSRRVEFLQKLFDLFSEYNASVEVQTEIRSEIDHLHTAEMHIDGCGDMVGDGPDGIQISDIERWLNCAHESLAEWQAYEGGDE